MLLFQQFSSILQGKLSHIYNDVNVNTTSKNQYSMLMTRSSRHSASEDIMTVISALQTAGICICCEGTTEGFLGLDIILYSDASGS